MDVQTLLAACLLTTDRTLLGQGHGLRWAGCAAD